MKHQTILQYLGNVDEVIKDNPSSERIFNAVDYCLYSCAELVLDHTTLFEEVLAVFFSTKTRKKLTSLRGEEFTRIVAQFYNCKGSDKVKYLRAMKLNRELIALPIQLLADNCDKYCQYLVDGNNATMYIRQHMLFKERYRDITLTLLKVRDGYKRYLEIREATVQKFYRLIVRDIGRYKYILKDKVDPNDMATEYYISVLRAFSKFDKSSGALANYAQNWFRNARSASLVTDEMGIAFQIPNAVKVKIARGEITNIYNFSTPVSEDTVCEHLGELEHMSEMQLIRDIISSCDETGIYSIINDVEINFKSKFNL